MNINTMEIKKGIITVDGKPFRIDMTISELEVLFNYKIENREGYVGHILSNSLTENGEHVYPRVWFENDNIDIFELEFGEFHSKDDALEYLNNWLNERDITEWIGSDEVHKYYKTEFGAVIPAIVQKCYDSFAYTVVMKLKYGQLPNRKFTQIRKNKNNTVNIAIDNVQYNVQRIPYKEVDTLPYLNNWLGDGPMRIEYLDDNYNKNNRMEIIYFNISKMENGIATVIGIVEFLYLAVLDTYKNSELFVSLDSLTEEWGIIAYTIEEYGCGLGNKKIITPYILAFENIHDEIPHNNDLETFINNKNCMKELFKSALYLTSKYVIIPEEDITLINVSDERDDMFSYYKKYNNTFINYQHLEKM